MLIDIVTRGWIALGLTSLLLCGGCDEPAEEELPPEPDPFADYEPDPDVFAAPIDMDNLVEIEGMQAPPDQVVLMLSEGGTLQEVLDASGGEVIGQAPEFGIYQLAVPTTTAAELGGAIDTLTAHPAVEAVLANHLLEPFDGPSDDACLSDDDVDQVATAPERCPLTEIQYRQFAPIGLEAAQRTGLHQVSMAVIDSGLAPETGQFNTIPFVNLRNPAQSCEDRDGHGTRVAAIVAADNGDGGVNGIAARVLGADHLRLFIGEAHSLMDAIACLVLAGGSAGVDVVNMSVGSFYDNVGWAAAANALLAVILTTYDDTLYVFPSGNNDKEIGLHNTAPMSIDLDNVITVGGTAHCAPETRWHTSNTYGSNWGSSVDIAAPAEDVLVQYFYPSNNMDLSSGPPDQHSGTSYAAPMVASTAAVLAAFAPDASPEQLRAAILDNSVPGPSDIGGRRLQMALALEQWLIDQDGSLAILELVDADFEPDFRDNVGVVVNRICGGGTISIAGVGTWTFEGDMQTNAGSLNPMGTTATFQDKGDGVFLSIQVEGAFQIETPTTIGGGAMIAFMGPDMTGGTGLTGNVQMTSCAITERDGYMDWPLMVSVSAVASGSMEVIGPPDYEPAPHDFEAGFTQPLITIGDEALNEYLEEHCDGGYGVD